MRFSYSFEQVNKRLLFLILIDLFFLILAIVSFKLGSQYVLLQIITSLIFLIPVKKTILEVDRFIRGEEGEDIVYRELIKLPNNFTFIHDFKKGNKGNVDFVVIHPNGIWTIEVKNKSFSYISSEQLILPDLNQAYAESEAIHSFISETLRISVPVHPVLVYANPRTKINFGFNKQKGVYVVGIRWLTKLLTSPNSNLYLNQEQCLKIKEELQKYTSII